jgi:uncharacterized protein (TIGR01244 family)
MIRRAFGVSLVLVAFFATLGLAQDQDPLADNSGINHYYRIRPDIATAGQPTDEALADIKKAGFKTVLSLRTAQEGSLEEKPKVEALGLEYVNIQVGRNGITPENVKLFSEIVGDSARRPLFIHCASSNRVGAFWYLHEVLDEGKDDASAMTEAEKAGLTSKGLAERAKAYAEQHKN